MTAKKINLVGEAHTITPNFRQVDVMGGYTAAACSNFIYSAQLPERLQGKAMVCEPTMKNVTEAIVYAVKLLGPEHVALGSDFDGGVPMPFDSSEMAALTSSLLDAGLDEKTVRMVMGENAIRFFSTYLPNN